eukprot:2359064-Karenia_brevis.AAC.1
MAADCPPRCPPCCFSCMKTLGGKINGHLFESSFVLPSHLTDMAKEVRQGIPVLLAVAGQHHQ